MPDKYGVGLGRNAISSQYTGVQRPKKKKKKPSDPLFIEFDTYDAQDGLMDEHDLNDIAKMAMHRSNLRKNILRAGAQRGGALIASSMTPEERSARTKAGWLKRKRAKPQMSKPRRMTPDQRSAARERLRAKGAASAEARRIVERGKTEEPKITKDIQDVVKEQGGKMYGLDFRLKEVDSLARKLLSKSKAKGVSVEEYGSQVGDAVRYTAIRDEPPPGQYANMIKATIDSLESKGYTILELETHWKQGDAYNGIHLVAATPSGQRFELQFHTEASVKAKFATHPLYEEMRKDGTTPGAVPSWFAR